MLTSHIYVKFKSLCVYKQSFMLVGTYNSTLLNKEMKWWIAITEIFMQLVDGIVVNLW